MGRRGARYLSDWTSGENLLSGLEVFALDHDGALAQLAAAMGAGDDFLPDEAALPEIHPALAVHVDLPWENFRPGEIGAPLGDAGRDADLVPRFL